jgi:DNA-binding response OmpR family regulator
VDLQHPRLRVGKRVVPLTPLEARLLALRRHEAGRVVSHSRLLSAGSGQNAVSRNNLHV